MGSKVYIRGNCFVAVNNDSHISCDFSNTIVCTDRLDSNLGNIFRIRPIQSYSILLDGQFSMLDGPEGKIASLMILWQQNFKKLIKITNFPDLVIKELTFSELNRFAEVVFDAFAYDEVNIAESLEFYKRGFSSGMIRYFGLIKEGSLVSVLLAHRNRNKSLYGLELVATSKQFQGKGYSKLLLTHVLEELFLCNPEAIWLFSIEGSIAESIYKKIGFSAVGKILISKLL